VGERGGVRGDGKLRGEGREKVREEVEVGEKRGYECE
jgi:hypothetical protein